MADATGASFRPRWCDLHLKSSSSADAMDAGRRMKVRQEVGGTPITIPDGSGSGRFRAGKEKAEAEEAEVGGRKSDGMRMQMQSPAYASCPTQTDFRKPTCPAAEECCGPESIRPTALS